MKIHWGLKLLIGLSAVFCMTYYLDSKSRVDLQSSLHKIATGVPDTPVGYNPAPLVAGIGLFLVILWLIAPLIKSWMETEPDIFDADQDRETNDQ